VVDTSVLVAGIAGLRPASRHGANIASARLLQRWTNDRHFVWLVTEEILEEYKSILRLRGVRGHLIGKIINTLRKKGEHVKTGPSLSLSPDPDDNHVCDCAEYGRADFLVTLNPKDFPQAGLSAKVLAPEDLS
jgi:predicted nucleic acid-binding protein